MIKLYTRYELCRGRLSCNARNCLAFSLDTIRRDLKVSKYHSLFEIIYVIDEDFSLFSRICDLVKSKKYGTINKW